MTGAFVNIDSIHSVVERCGCERTTDRFSTTPAHPFGNLFLALARRRVRRLSFRDQRQRRTVAFALHGHLQRYNWLIRGATQSVRSIRRAIS